MQPAFLLQLAEWMGLSGEESGPRECGVLCWLGDVGQGGRDRKTHVPCGVAEVCHLPLLLHLDSSTQS